ncbi:MAG: hypothetical protein LUG13_03735 [Oscillospiraceae bacterium]|nr:hypothetical protein [Oscillospiraceae bacterium]
MINCIKHKNINNGKIEFILVNFEYYDGNDLISKIFCEKYKMFADEKIDGIYFSVIKLHSEDGKVDYELLWHEDVGNSIISIQQDEKSLLLLEQRLAVVSDVLNNMIAGN